MSNQFNLTLFNFIYVLFITAIYASWMPSSIQTNSDINSYYVQMNCIRMTRLRPLYKKLMTKWLSELGKRHGVSVRPSTFNKRHFKCIQFLLYGVFWVLSYYSIVLGLSSVGND